MKKLLGVDYISVTAEKSENLQFIFSGGVLNQSQIDKIKLQESEISEYKFLSITKALPLLSQKLQKRIPKCLEALKNNSVCYLENGELV